MAQAGLPQPDGVGVKVIAVVVVVVVVVVLSSKQKLSDTRIGTDIDLADFSSWLSVDKLHIPEEQVTW